TRARRRLFLSRAMMSSSWGQPMSNPGSRFLEEIPPEAIEWQREEPAGGIGGSGRSGGDPFAPRRRFGPGAGSGSSPGIPRASATIDFGASGKVRLMLIGGVPMQKL